MDLSFPFKRKTHTYSVTLVFWAIWEVPPYHQQREGGKRADPPTCHFLMVFLHICGVALITLSHGFYCYVHSLIRIVWCLKVNLFKKKTNQWLCLYYLTPQKHAIKNIFLPCIWIVKLVISAVQFDCCVGCLWGLAPLKWAFCPHVSFTNWA